MTTLISYKANKDYKKVRQFLKERRYPKAILISLKDDPQLLLINGIKSKITDPISVGDIITTTIVENRKVSEHIVPLEGELDIVYEDEHLLVINKPHHMAIHPSINHREMSLANIVTAYALSKHERYPFRCINRLDRDTTGVVIIAKNRLAAAILSQDIAERRVKREYIAVCKGIFDRKEGIVDAPIGRVPGSAILRQVDYDHGQQAITHYKVMDESKDHSLVSLVLDTGRCHQIRIHMSYLGHPLPADYLYFEDYSLYETIPLHAKTISFTHPVTGEDMVFTKEEPFLLI